MARCALSVCVGQTTAHFISRSRAKSQGVALGHTMGAGENGHPEKGSGTEVKTEFVYLLWFCSGPALFQGIESFLFRLQLSRCGEGGRADSFVLQESRSPSRSSRCEEGRARGGLDCLRP